MNCQKTREQLQDFLSEKLNPKQKVIIEEHLHNCQDCRDELAFLEVYFKKAINIAMAEAPSNLLANIHRRLDETETKIPKKSFSGFFTPLTAGLTGTIGVMAVAILMFFLLSPLKQVPEKISAIERSTGSFDKAVSIKETKPTVTAVSAKKNDTNLANHHETVITLTVAFTKNPAVTDDKLLRKAGLSKNRFMADAAAEPAEQSESTPKTVLEPKQENNVSIQSEIEAKKPNSGGIAVEIKEIAKKLQGRILNEQYNQTGEPEELLLIIPGANYRQLFNELDKLGAYAKPEIGKQIPDEIRIKLQFSYKTAND